MALKMPDPEVLEWVQQNAEMIKKFVSYWQKMYEDESEPIQQEEEKPIIVDSYLVQYVNLLQSGKIELGGYTSFQLNEKINYFELGFHFQNDEKNIFNPNNKLNQ